MSSHLQQHLDSDNLHTIDRAMTRVRTLRRTLRGSTEESRIAAVMVGEFQKGNTTEQGLYAVFLPKEESVEFSSENASGRDSDGSSLVPMLVGSLVLIFLGSIMVMTFA